MNPIEPGPIPGRTPLPPSALPPVANPLQRSDDLSTMSQPAKRRTGYGMPCVKCKTYYAAELSACPVCQATERMAPMATLADVSAVIEPDDPAAIEEAALEEERERFLREFQSKTYAESIQAEPITTFRCVREEEHDGAMEPAEVCQDCYESLRRRADLSEAALHLDVNEATQIIYEAVWSDPSNPSKTYQNAAQALLNELHRRAGIPSILGHLQPLSD